jgi:hypothetical protein
MAAISVPELDIYSRRGQEIVVVLYALRELGAIHTKQEVIRFIREHRFYDLQPGDKCSYDGKHEWKADTLLCWGRKDAVMGEWMFDHDEKDSWELAREGRRALQEIISRFRSDRWDVRECFLWRPELKRLIDPRYVPSIRDAARPRGYRQQSPKEMARRLLARLQRQLGLPRTT